MQFTVHYYREATGAAPIDEFLAELKRTDQDEWDRLLLGLRKLQDGARHHGTLTKPLGGKLFEFRHLGRLNIRMLFVFQSGARILIVHAIRNKGQKISGNDLQTARSRQAIVQKRGIQ